MRYLTAIFMAMFLATSALAASPYCTINDPANCVRLNEDKLLSQTKNTIRNMQFTQGQHAFKTQNDVVLESAAAYHAHNRDSQQGSGFLFWKK